MTVGANVCQVATSLPRKEIVHLQNRRLCIVDVYSYPFLHFNQRYPVMFFIETSDAESNHRPGVMFDDMDALLQSGLRFPTIYADPPWEYQNSASRAAACKHYSTMSLDKICALNIQQLATENAHLHLWATNPLLPLAFKVIEAWGFRYTSCFVWTKEKLGMGNYWRVSHEFLLLGVRGSLRFNERDKRSWQTWKRTRHSKKPNAMRCLIERVSPGPFLELFGREEIPNSDWTVFGNQIERRLF